MSLFGKGETIEVDSRSGVRVEEDLTAKSAGSKKELGVGGRRK
jgi:hypothetical protein